MIKAFTLGLIVGAVFGTLFGLFIMAVLQACGDYNPSQINDNATQATKEQELDKLYSKAKEQVNFDFTDGVYDLSE